MAYTREERDWVEAEWAYHLHGRSAFLSGEDFRQLLAWEAQGVPADLIVAAMEAFFTRRAKRARPRTIVTLAHLERDVAKALKLRAALRRAEEGELAPAPGSDWAQVGEPLRSQAPARAAFEAWRRLKAAAPPPDSPGYLDHYDAERKARKALAALAEAALGPGAEPLKAALADRLRASGIPEGGPVWARAWDHHWTRSVWEAWGIPD